jgi:hypothetical protein
VSYSKFPLITTMAAHGPPQNLDESIKLISAAVSKVFANIPNAQSAVPSSHTSIAAVSALERNGGALGVKKLEYTNFTDQFVESFRKTPVPSQSGNRTDHFNTTNPIIRSRKYDDVFDENRDRKFVSDLYFPVVCVLRSHILHAWDQAPDNLKPELLSALDSLIYEELDDQIHGTRADLVCTMMWEGKRVTLLRFEYKNNGYALHKYAPGHSVAGLISQWRDEQLENLNDKKLVGVSGGSKASKILMQVQFLHGCRRVPF